MIERKSGRELSVHIPPLVQNTQYAHGPLFDQVGNHSAPFECNSSPSWSNVVARASALGERSQAIAALSNPFHIGSRGLWIGGLGYPVEYGPKIVARGLFVNDFMGHVLRSPRTIP